MKSNVLLGIDGGGTFTRVAVADADGNLLAYVDRKGAANQSKDLNAKENVRIAICEALAMADRRLEDVSGLAAGIAGFDDESDLEWVRGLTDIEGLNCPSRHVNDAVSAQAGAFLLKPGIIAICGTGSIIFAINEAGRHFRNYDFYHYATAARHLAFDALYHIIAGETEPADFPLIGKAIDHFGVRDIPALAMLGSEGFAPNRQDMIRQLGDFAPAITCAADDGCPLAQRVCGRASEAIVTGIKLLGACFNEKALPVALIGGLANSAPIKRAVGTALKLPSNKCYTLTEPALSPALGAVLMAMEAGGIALNDGIVQRLKASSRGES